MLATEPTLSSRRRDATVIQLTGSKENEPNCFVNWGIQLVPAPYWDGNFCCSRSTDQTIGTHEADVADVPGKETVIYIADVVPGGEGARHTHYGDEFVYILEGSLVVTPDGKEPI